MVMVEAQVSIAVMAHHSRVRDALALGTALDAVVVIDEDDDGEDWCAHEAWGQLEGDGWGIVLQDDALPIEDFVLHADEALAHCPPALVSFYVGTGRPRQPEVHWAIEHADAIGATWLEADHLLWGVAAAMPMRYVDDYLAWNGHARDKYDRRLGRFAQHVGMPILYTWPSLVDHRPGPSVVEDRRLRAPRPDVERRAHRVGYPPRWDTPTIRIPNRNARLP